MASKKQKTTYASKLEKDPDLSSPLHDEIQMWAIKNKAALWRKLLSMTTTNAIKDRPIKCEVEYPIKKHLQHGGFGKSIAGYMDVVIYWDPSAFPYDSFFIEIKSKITSFGEIMRELQFYKSHLDVPKNHIVLLAPSIPFADMNREQGFTVLEYKTDLFEV